MLAAVNYADPLTAAGHDKLGDLLLAQTARASEALSEYQVLLALQPLDTATANYGLARAYRLTGDAARSASRACSKLWTPPRTTGRRRNCCWK